MTDERIQAWHFVADTRLLRDGTPCEVGRTYSVGGPLIMCEHGLHASERILDALGYASGSVVCQVEVWGDVLRDADKLVARNRQVLSMIDATAILHEFACRCAENALNLAHVTDKRCWAAIEAKRWWLRREISDEGLAAARSVAMDAAWAAAWDAQNRLLQSMVLTAMGKEVQG